MNPRDLFCSSTERHSKTLSEITRRTLTAAGFQQVVSCRLYTMRISIPRKETVVVTG